LLFTVLEVKHIASCRVKVQLTHTHTHTHTYIHIHTSNTRCLGYTLIFVLKRPRFLEIMKIRTKGR
jgi:hypothetical protein